MFDNEAAFSITIRRLLCFALESAVWLVLSAFFVVSSFLEDSTVSLAAFSPNGPKFSSLSDPDGHSSRLPSVFVEPDLGLFLRDMAFVAKLESEDVLLRRERAKLGFDDFGFASSDGSSSSSTLSEAPSSPCAS